MDLGATYKTTNDMIKRGDLEKHISQIFIQQLTVDGTENRGKSSLS